MIEDISPDQIVYIMHLVLVCVLLYALSHIIPAILNYRSMKHLEVIIQTKDSIEPKKSWFSSWLEKRKENKKKDEFPYTLE